MIGVQDKQNIDGFLEHRVRRVRAVILGKQHAQEIARIG
jgi:hypothetical protein